LLALRKSSGLKAAAVIEPGASIRVCSQLPRRGAIATGSTCALSPDKPASFAAESHRTRIIFDTCSHGRSAVRPAMNSPYRYAGCITARLMAGVTSEHGGSSQYRPGAFGGARACHRESLFQQPGRVFRAGQFGTTSAPRWPHCVHTKPSPSVLIGVSSGRWPTFMIVL
jgi:hypothetical protein